MCHVHTDGEQHGDHEDARAWKRSNEPAGSGGFLLQRCGLLDLELFIGLRMVYTRLFDLDLRIIASYIHFSLILMIYLMIFIFVEKKNS